MDVFACNSANKPSITGQNIQRLQRLLFWHHSYEVTLNCIWNFVLQLACTWHVKNITISIITEYMDCITLTQRLVSPNSSCQNASIPVSWDINAQILDILHYQDVVFWLHWKMNEQKFAVGHALSPGGTPYRKSVKINEPNYQALIMYRTHSSVYVFSANLWMLNDWIYLQFVGYMCISEIELTCYNFAGKYQWTVLSGQLVWQRGTVKQENFVTWKFRELLALSVWDVGQNRHAHTDRQYAILSLAGSQNLCQTMNFKLPLLCRSWLLPIIYRISLGMLYKILVTDPKACCLSRES